MITSEFLKEVDARLTRWPGIDDRWFNTGGKWYWNFQPGDMTKYRFFAIRATAIGANLGWSSMVVPTPCAFFGWQLSDKLNVIMRRVEDVTYSPLDAQSVMSETGMNKYNSAVFVKCMAYAAGEIIKRGDE